MKKLFAVFLVVLLTLTTFAPAFAQEVVVTESKTLNEYQYTKELKQKTDEELKNEGFSDEQIKQIRNFDYSKALKERAKLDEKTLKNLGYSDEQVKKLKEFKGTEEEINALAATLTLDAYHINFWYDQINKRSYWKVGFIWSWSSRPFFEKTDIIGAGWAPTMSLLTSESYNSVTYKSTISPGVAPYTKNYYFSLANTNCGKATFPLYDSVNYAWAASGSGFVKVTAGGQIRDMQMRVSYGHSQVSISNPTLQYPWGISFTFSSGVNEEASKTIQYYY